MYKNLPTLEEVHYMDNITDLRNALRWCIRHIESLEAELGKTKRRKD